MFLSDRLKLLLERFNSLSCYDWESVDFEKEGDLLVAAVEKVRPLMQIKSSGRPVQDWLHTIEDADFEDDDSLAI